MKSVFSTVLLASLVLAAFSVSIKRRPGVRIIGGREANAGEFPFAVAIHKQTDSGQFFCGGALLNTQWILTSASCVDGATLFSLTIGSNNLKDDRAERFATDTYFIHPDYDVNTLNNDVGLIKLRLPLSFTDYIQPITLPTRDVQTYAVVRAIGWGQLSNDAAGLTDDLNTVDLTALSNEECRFYFGNQITENMVCVDGNYNEGTCLGDTGGPLIQYVSGHHASIVGISSFISGNGCESTDPSGYTRVFPYVAWLADVLAENS